MQYHQDVHSLRWHAEQPVACVPYATGTMWYFNTVSIPQLMGIARWIRTSNSNEGEPTRNDAVAVPSKLLLDNFATNPLEPYHYASGRWHSVVVLWKPPSTAEITPDP
jgi:hypothetical protein